MVAARMTSQQLVGQIRKAADATLLPMVAVRTSSHPRQDLMERVVLVTRMSLAAALME